MKGAAQCVFEEKCVIYAESMILDYLYDFMMEMFQCIIS